MSRPLLVMAVVLVVCLMKSHVISSAVKLGTDWRIVTYTGTRHKSDTDDAVHIRIYGTKGTSYKRALDNRGDDREEPGSVDTYRLTTKDVGNVTRIEVWGGLHLDGWFVKKIEIERDDDRYSYQAYLFECNCWFILGGASRRVLWVTRMIAKRAWKITTYTGDHYNYGAETRDATYFKIGGNKGWSEFRMLNKRDNQLDRKERSVYLIRVFDVGTPSGIGIKAGLRGDSWQLAKVEAESFINGTMWVYVFDCGGKLFNRESEPWIVQRYFNLTSKESKFT